MAEETFEYALSDSVRTIAMGFPEFSEGSSCVNRAFKAGGKNFLFLGEKPGECNLRLKLNESLPEIERRANKEPEVWQAGKGGWCFFRFDPDKPPAKADLEQWITESFMLLAPKKISKAFAG